MKLKNKLSCWRVKLKKKDIHLEKNQKNELS
jgi:hypothetical protein